MVRMRAMGSSDLLPRHKLLLSSSGDEQQIPLRHALLFQRLQPGRGKIVQFRRDVEVVLECQLSRSSAGILTDLSLVQRRAHLGCKRHRNTRVPFILSSSIVTLPLAMPLTRSLRLSALLLARDLWPEQTHH